MKKYLEASITTIRKNPRRTFGTILIVLVVVVAAVLVFHHSSGPHPSKPTLHNIPQNFSSISISGDGSARAFGIAVVAIAGNTITATGTFNNIPLTLTITTDGNTLFHIINATSSLSDVEKGQVLMVTGMFQGFNSTIVIAAKDVRVAGLVGGIVPHPAISGQAVTGNIRHATSTTSLSAATTTKSSVLSTKKK